MAYGNVYVFNLYGSAATQVNINEQGSAGSIASPVKGSTAPFYAPQQIAVGRTNLTPDQLNNPLFCNGPNKIKVNYDGYNWSGTITIPGPATIPLQQDLWLYLAYGQMFLFDTTGAIVPQPSGGGLKATKGGGKALSAPLTKDRGGVSAKATVNLSGGGAKGGASKGGASKGGGSKGGGSKGGASKGGAKKSAKKSR